MGEYKHRRTEPISGRQAAEHPIDIAHLLTVGPPLELRVGGEHIIPDELRMEGEVMAEGQRARLELKLSWSRAACTA